MNDKSQVSEISVCQHRKSCEDLNTLCNIRLHMLYNMPSEIVGAIAELCGPFAIGMLWSCGSRQLNSAISSASGMRRYHIRSSFRNGPSAPSFVYDLKGLKELLIHPAADEMFQLPSNFLFNLPYKTVETISLHTESFLSCWSKREFLSYLIPKSTPMDFKTYYPHLKSLDLVCHEYPTCPHPRLRILDSLPHGLTRLSINVTRPPYDPKFVSKSVFKFPQTLIELTLGIWTFLNLNFVFELLQLKTLVLPLLRHGHYTSQNCRPLTSLETLEIPNLEWIGESDEVSGSEMSTTHFLSMMPNISRFNCKMGTLNCSSSFRSQLRHLSLSLYDGSLIELPLMLNTLSIEFGTTCTPETLNLSNLPFLTSFSSESQSLHRLSQHTLRNMPSSLTFLSCEDAEERLDFIPPSVVHLHCHRSYQPITTESIPDTLLVVTSEVDRALNMRKVSSDWKGASWASLSSCVSSDDVDTFKTIWNYSLIQLPPGQIRSHAIDACQMQSIKILDYLTSLDDFWQDNPKMSNPDASLLNLVPFGRSLDLLFTKGFFIHSDIPSELLLKALRDRTTNQLVSLFSNCLGKFSPQHKRKILTLAFLVLNEVCVRWLLDEGFHDIELRDLVGLLSQQTESTRWLDLAKPLVRNYVRRDASFPEFLQKSVIMPVDHMFLNYEEQMERQLKELNWVQDAGIPLPRNTLTMVCRKYEKLCSRGTTTWQRVRIEYPFFQVFKWLSKNGFDLTRQFKTASNVTTSLEACATSYGHFKIVKLAQTRRQ